jgi:hypothetical protein
MDCPDQGQRHHGGLIAGGVRRSALILGQSARVLMPRQLARDRISGPNRRAGAGKRRLRLAEAAAHRRGLDGTLASYRETVKVALVHLDTTGQSEGVVDAIRATVADTDEDIAEVAADEAMTRRALDLLFAATQRYV